MFLEENNKIKIILASKSPRRADILDMLHVDFEVFEPTEIKEEILDDPASTVIFNSSKKAKNIASRVKIDKSDFLDKKAYKDILVAGFDTIVFMRGEFFAKPKDENEAKSFLKKFSCKTHEVYTGISLIRLSDDIIIEDFERTYVTFRKINEREIDSYLKKENIFDKAGAYNLGGYGSIMVRKINGCFYNVAGLPIYKFIEMVKKLGYKIDDMQK